LKVGHTGIYEAAVEAVTATDKAVGTIFDAAHKHGYVLLITADHGNAEQMKDPKTGNPHTAHTTNLVPFLMAGFGEAKGLKFKEDKEKGENSKADEEDLPALCDVAPTVLDLLVCLRFLGMLSDHLMRMCQGLPIPEEMTGRSLLAHE
jgi:2,3-bisphosphoglycerate-independent phosphoglycerate mutase